MQYRKWENIQLTEYMFLQKPDKLFILAVLMVFMKLNHIECVTKMDVNQMLELCQLLCIELKVMKAHIEKLFDFHYQEEPYSEQEKQILLKIIELNWSKEEDLQLCNFVLENGKKWFHVVKILQGRNQNQVKNRFNKIFKTQLSNNYSKYQKFSPSIQERQAIIDYCQNLKKQQNQQLQSLSETNSISDFENQNEEDKKLADKNNFNQQVLSKESSCCNISSPEVINQNQQNQNTNQLGKIDQQEDIFFSDSEYENEYYTSSNKSHNSYKQQQSIQQQSQLQQQQQLQNQGLRANLQFLQQFQNTQSNDSVNTSMEVNLGSSNDNKYEDIVMIDSGNDSENNFYNFFLKESTENTSNPEQIIENMQQHAQYNKNANFHIGQQITAFNGDQTIQKTNKNSFYLNYGINNNYRYSNQIVDTQQQQLYTNSGNYTKQKQQQCQEFVRQKTINQSSQDIFDFNREFLKQNSNYLLYNPEQYIEQNNLSYNKLQYKY